MVAVTPMGLHQCGVYVCSFNGSLVCSDRLYEAGKGEVGSVSQDALRTVGNEFECWGIDAVMCESTAFTLVQDKCFDVFGCEFIDDS